MSIFRRPATFQNQASFLCLKHPSGKRWIDGVDVDGGLSGLYGPRPISVSITSDLPSSYPSMTTENQLKLKINLAKRKPANVFETFAPQN